MRGLLGLRGWRERHVHHFAAGLLCAYPADGCTLLLPGFGRFSSARSQALASLVNHKLLSLFCIIGMATENLSELGVMCLG